MEKEITLHNGKKITIRELFAIEVDDIDFDNKKEAIKKQVILSTGMSEIEFRTLTLRERLQIIQAINEVNGISDFPQRSKDI